MANTSTSVSDMQRSKKQGSIILLTVRVLLLSMLSQQAESAAGNAINHGAWSPLCGVADKLAASATTAEANLQKSLTAQNSAIADRLKVMIYARRASGTDKKAAKIAAAGLAKNGKITNTEIINGVKKTIDAQQRQLFAGAHSRILNDSSKRLRDTATHGCLENGGHRNACRNHWPKQMRTKSARRTRRKHGDQRAKPYTMYNNLWRGRPQATGSTTSKWQLTNHNNKSIIQDQSLEAPLKFAAGYLTTDHSSGDITAEQKPPLQDGITYTAPEAYKPAGEALIALMTDKVAKGAEHNRAIVATIKTVLGAKKLAHTLLLNKTSDYNDAADGEAAETAISTTLKDAENEAEMAIWRKMKITEIENKVYKDYGEGKASLEDINDIGDLLTILEYYETQATNTAEQKIKQLEADLKKEQEATKVDKKTMEEICAELKDADTCRNNANCKYEKDKKEEPKCVLSDKGKEAEVEKEAGKDDKTNTTGSNSFVIKKAPLWLAVLLF
uniref:Variable surface glycoprotein n=1 Tax=Trypanosoma evansi TaxID=5697 RepID=Q968K9_TRYEV|nr:variable surface glycoprotein [Trypanosoma evansi]